MERDKAGLNIKIITTSPFPVGLASTNRIMTYAKGLTENGCTVTVLCMKTTEEAGKVFNKAIAGETEGINFRYLTDKTIVSANRIRRRYDDFTGLIKTCLTLLRENRKNKTDVVIFYSFSLPRALALFLTTRIKKSLYLVEESEIPTVYTKNMSILSRIVHINLFYYLFDGLLLMTKRLIKYFVEEKKMKTPYLHVPMTVDLSRFDINKKKRYNTHKYIAYCGILNNEKDGTDLLIEAFSTLAREFEEIELYLIGNSSSMEEEIFYKKKISEDNLTDRVVFTGRVGKDEIPYLLLNATVLVLPRPDSIQAEAGFPTKLGEYLATGNPVVVTSVGEIPDYLTDGINAFIAEPGKVSSLYEKIKSILVDYEKAKAVGEEGRKVAVQYFNYKNQTRKLMDFMKSLQNNVF